MKLKRTKTSLNNVADKAEVIAREVRSSLGDAAYDVANDAWQMYRLNTHDTTASYREDIIDL